MGTATRPPRPLRAPLRCTWKCECREAQGCARAALKIRRGEKISSPLLRFRIDPRCSGFTLLELLATLMILAVLTATVSMRWGATDATIAYQADLLARNLRHAQMLAMTWGQSLRVTGAGASYSAACVTASAMPPCNSTPVIDPATGSAFTVSLSNNVTVSASTVDIDSLGRPLSAGALLTAARTFTLSGAGQTWSVAVAPITGFISVSSP